MNEILMQNPDIVCLQEVTKEHYHLNFKPTFEENNFGSIYKQKNSQFADGCAIFFNNDKFCLKYFHEIDIIPILPLNWRIQTALCVVLIPKNIKNLYLNKNLMAIAIVTTHLKFSPNNDYYRCIQLEYLLNEIKQLKLQSLIPDIPIILCGDFNSLINSQPIQLLLNHYPPQSSIDKLSFKENFTFHSSSNLACKIRPKNSNYGIVNSSLEMFDFNFKSAIPLIQSINKCINGQNINHQLFSSCIDQKNPNIVDYIFYHNPSIVTSDYKFIKKSNRTYIEPYNFLDIPSTSIDNLSKFCLPNEYHPSDHFPLIVDFCLYNK